MSSDTGDKKRESSIVMRAIDASTFSELQAFTKDLESRPIERLLRDIAGLVDTTESKAQIVGYVIATKYNHGDETVRATILKELETTIASLPQSETRSRIQDFVLDRIRR